MQENFDRNENANQRMSEVIQEVSNMEELLMELPAARHDLEMEKNAQKTAQVELDRRKDVIGNTLLLRSMKRLSSTQVSNEYTLAENAKELRQYRVRRDEDMEECTFYSSFR